jgi:hypothetical protein
VTFEDLKIVPGMQVRGAGGEYIGTVRAVNEKGVEFGAGGSALGGLHRIPIDWVERVDAHVHLAQSRNELLSGPAVVEPPRIADPAEPLAEAPAHAISTAAPRADQRDWTGAVLMIVFLLIVAGILAALFALAS